MFVSKAKHDLALDEERKYFQASLNASVSTLEAKIAAIKNNIGETKTPFKSLFWSLYGDSDSLKSVREVLGEVRSDLYLIKQYLGIEKKTVAEKTA